MASSKGCDHGLAAEMKSSERVDPRSSSQYTELVGLAKDEHMPLSGLQKGVLAPSEPTSIAQASQEVSRV